MADVVVNVKTAILDGPGVPLAITVKHGSVNGIFFHFSAISDLAKYVAQRLSFHIPGKFRNLNTKLKFILLGF